MGIWELPTETGYFDWGGSMGRANQQMLEDEARGWSDPEDKYVCADCVDDAYLKEIIQKNVS